MSVAQHLGSICKGAGIGFLFGLASIATVDQKTLFVLLIVNKPVEALMWLGQKGLGWSDGSTALIVWFCTALYWTVIGGLIGWGVSVLYAKITGDE